VVIWDEKFLNLHKGREPHVQITRHKKDREEKAAENSQGKEAGQTGKEEEQVARAQAISVCSIQNV
jgi:hypothetical protein